MSLGRGEGEGETEGEGGKTGRPREEVGESSGGKDGGIGKERETEGPEVGGRDPGGELTFRSKYQRSGSVCPHKSLLLNPYKDSCELDVVDRMEK